MHMLSFPGDASGKEPACQCRRHEMLVRSVLGRSLGIENGSSLQYVSLENSMDRGAWPGTVHGVAKNCTQLKQLSTHTRIRKKQLVQDSSCLHGVLTCAQQLLVLKRPSPTCRHISAGTEDNSLVSIFL